MSERAKADLKKARDMGIDIALVSGRMIHAIEVVERQLEFSCIKASAAGTYIMMDGECISDSTMKLEYMLKLYEEIAVKYDIPLWIYRGTRWYVTEINHYVIRESNIIGYMPIEVDIYSLAKQWKMQGLEPNKILFSADAGVIDQIKGEMEKYQSLEVDFARSDDLYLEVFPKGANKGRAVESICNALNIDINRTIAFGDQELDIPMLQTAAFGVAMDNSPEQVKEVADAVTRSNDEDGIAYALEKYVLV